MKNTTQPPLEPAIQRFREKFTCKIQSFGKEVDVLGYWDEDNQLRQYKPEQIEAFISDELKAERERILREFEEVIKSEQLRTIDISKDVHETNQLNTFDIGVNCGLSMVLANIRSKIKPINQEMKKMEGSCYCRR